MTIMTERPAGCRARRAIAAAGFFCLALALSACAGNPVAVRDIQDNFSRAAAQENALRLQTQALDPVGYAVRESEMRTRYIEVADAVAALGPADRERLEADRLWGTLLMMKAFAELRADRHAAAQQTRQAFMALEPAQRLPRDRALMAALPGLIANDQAVAVYREPLPPGCDGACALAERKRRFAIVGRLMTDGTNGAFAVLDNASRTVAPDHPVQAYLLQARILAYANFQDAGGTFAEFPRNPELRRYYCRAHQDYAELTATLAGLDDESGATAALLERLRGEAGLAPAVPEGC